jgi:hypothetical protein
MYKICVTFKNGTMFGVHTTYRYYEYDVKDEGEKYRELFKILYEHCDISNDLSYFNIRKFESIFRSYSYLMLTRMLKDEPYKREEFIFQGLYDMLQSQYKLLNQQKWTVDEKLIFKKKENTSFEIIVKEI